MNRNIIIVFLLFTVSLNAQDAYRWRLLGNWNDTLLPVLSNPDDQRWNELTGWVDTVTGKEYVIMGSIDSVYFFDVTDPENIRLCDVRWGLNRVVNRDIEVFGHYAYCVSDNGPPGKMQIYDLQYLPDSASLVWESDTFGHNVHSMFVSPGSKRLYLCSVRKAPLRYAMMVLSIDTPDQPSFLGILNTAPSACLNVHETYVRNDTAYCSCEYNGLFVYDLTDMKNQKLLGGITPPYPYNGYNHTNWPDSVLAHIAFTDELPAGQPVKVFRIRALDDMTYLSHFNTHPGATPHNLFWVGNILYVSWYHDGVYAWDMTNPRKPVIHAFYDTYPQNAEGNYEGFRGCWGVFPFLPSGNIAASDMTNGLFMLRFDQSVGLNNMVSTENIPLVYPNPAQNELFVKFNESITQRYTLTCSDLQGRQWLKKVGITNNDSDGIIIEGFSELTQGVYLLHAETETGRVYTLKVIKQ